MDYDAGASAVNQENRIKLMLSIARDNKAEQTQETIVKDSVTAEAAATISENNDIEDDL